MCIDSELAHLIDSLNNITISITIGNLDAIFRFIEREKEDAKTVRKI